MVIMLSILVLIGISPQSAIPFPDGVELLRSCAKAVAQADGLELQEREDMLRSSYCIGYVSGILDGLALMNWKGGTTKVCVPTDGIANDQAIRIVVKFLKANPERLHESGRSLVLQALGEAFKC